MGLNHDLARVLAEMTASRAALSALVRGLPQGALDRARPGGWTVRRVLQHVIESEAVYAKLLAHQSGRAPHDLETSEPIDGADAVRKLDTTASIVREMIDGIDDATLYRLVRFGHEEYSPLSVLENIAAHDREHHRQIVELLAYRDNVTEPIRAPAATDVLVRPAQPDDLAPITEIYNHYIVHTPITFDLDPVTVEERRPWFAQFSETGRHRLLVAVDGTRVIGYACSHQFRTKAAYDSTVETTIYLHPDACGRGVGGRLYGALFDVLATEDVRALVAGITLPNPASVALHTRFGFVPAGVMHAVGRKFGEYWDVGWYERAAQ